MLKVSPSATGQVGNASDVVGAIATVESVCTAGVDDDIVTFVAKDLGGGGGRSSGQAITLGATAHGSRETVGNVNNVLADLAIDEASRQATGGANEVSLGAALDRGGRALGDRDGISTLAALNEVQARVSGTEGECVSSTATKQCGVSCGGSSNSESISTVTELDRAVCQRVGAHQKLVSLRAETKS